MREGVRGTSESRRERRSRPSGGRVETTSQDHWSRLDQARHRHHLCLHPSPTRRRGVPVPCNPTCDRRWVPVDVGSRKTTQVGPLRTLQSVWFPSPGGTEAPLPQKKRGSGRGGRVRSRRRDLEGRGTGPTWIPRLCENWNSTLPGTLDVPHYNEPPFVTTPSPYPCRPCTVRHPSPEGTSDGTDPPPSPHRPTVRPDPSGGPSPWGAGEPDGLDAPCGREGREPLAMRGGSCGNGGPVRVSRRRGDGRVSGKGVKAVEEVFQESFRRREKTSGPT